MPATSKTVKLDDRVVLLLGQAAKRAGVAESTFRGYVTKGKAPQPDDHIDGRTPVWYPETIEGYRPAKPRKGRPKRA